MKFTSVAVTVAVSLALQLALARYAAGGRWLFDFVLIGVVYAALNWGSVAGMLAGTIGGILQDLLSNDVVGTGGLTKTLVGFASGVVGTQFVIGSMARVGLLAGASVVHRMLVIGLRAVIDQQWHTMPWGALAGETLLNALCGLIVFQLGESLPGAVSRGRKATRSGLKRREW